MMMQLSYIGLGLLTLSLMVACVPTGTPATQKADFQPEYLAVDTRLMKPELVNMIVSMRGARSAIDVMAYVECTAAQYTVIRGQGFARRVKTQISEKNGIWTADAIYTLSGAHPGGRDVIDAEVTVDDCAAHNIPTV